MTGFKVGLREVVDVFLSNLPACKLSLEAVVSIFMLFSPLTLVSEVEIFSKAKLSRVVGALL